MRFSPFSFFSSDNVAVPTELLYPAVEHWYQSKLGQLLLASETETVKQTLGDCFGYHLLQLSVVPSNALHKEARVQKKFDCYPIVSKKNDQHVDVYANFEQLPFEAGSIDTVIVHHCHEFADSPQQVLREVERVTVNGGHVIIVGFNPFSFMGLQSLIARFLPRSIWHNHLVNRHRMVDWLTLLGFQCQQQFFGYPLLEKNCKSASSRLLRVFYALMEKLPLGSFYCISAVKRQAAITPDVSYWLKRTPTFAPLRPKANIRQNKVTPIKKPSRL